MKPNWKKVKSVLKVTGKAVLIVGGTVSAVVAAVLAAQKDEKSDSAETPKYAVQMVNTCTGEVIETYDDDDEIFSTYEDAAHYASECSSSFGVGAEISEDMGKEFVDSDEVEFIVTEIEI